MTIEVKLLNEIASGDSASAEQFVERYASPLFRYCRRNFSDHHRTGEFVERYLAGVISRLKSGQMSPESLEEIFVDAEKLTRLMNKDYEQGRGLSKKQNRILELLDRLPFGDRLALDLVELEGREIPEVTDWLEISVEKVFLIRTEFEKMLSTDETIMEFLENAAIQQTRQRRAAQRGPKEKRPPVRQEQVPASSQPRKNEGYTRTWHEADDKKDREERSAGREPEEESVGTAEERKKPRPRRRRVDPRKLNLDL